MLTLKPKQSKLLLSTEDSYQLQGNKSLKQIITFGSPTSLKNQATSPCDPCT